MLHQLQQCYHQAQQAQLRELIVHPYLGEGSDKGHQPLYPILQQVKSTPAPVRRIFHLEDLKVGALVPLGSGLDLSPQPCTEGGRKQTRYIAPAFVVLGWR